MNTTRRWLRHCLICLFPLLLSACTSYGVPLVPSGDRITSVAALGSHFKPLPLRVAVYVAPQVLDSHVVFDNHADSNYPYVVDFGRIGPAVAAAVAKYVPSAFAKTYLVSSFPDRRLVGKPIDAVFVIEHVAESRWRAAMGQEGWDVSISAGLYGVHGEPVAHYSVVASRVPKSRTFEAATPAWIAWEVRNATAAVGPAVRLALRRLPRGQVLDYFASHGAGMRGGPGAERGNARYWRQRRGAFAQRIATDRPRLPVPTITLLEYAKLRNSGKPNAKRLANALEGACTDIAAQQYPGMPSAYDGQMMVLGALNQAAAGFYARQYRMSSAGQDPGKAPLLFQRLSRDEARRENEPRRRRDDGMGTGAATPVAAR